MAVCWNWIIVIIITIIIAATFGWLCVETSSFKEVVYEKLQPPSGGCVLKLGGINSTDIVVVAATFGWLCVETRKIKKTRYWSLQPPSGGCVLKPYQYRAHGNRFTPATFGGYTLKQILINLNSIIFTFLLYLSTRFIPNNIPPCISPLFTLDYAPFLAFMIYNYACFWLSFWLTWWADCSLP